MSRPILLRHGSPARAAQADGRRVAMNVLQLTSEARRKYAYLLVTIAAQVDWG
jgi:hypothetical protein